MATTQQVRDWYAANRCNGGRLAVIRFFNKGPVRVAPELVDAAHALESTLLKAGYQPGSNPYIGSYNCRPIAGTNRYSLHSYGVALDIDYAHNPHLHRSISRGFGTDRRFKFTEDQVKAGEAIKNTHGQQLWRWLGWSIGDTMHWEIQVPPNRAQVDQATVGHVPTSHATNTASRDPEVRAHLQLHRTLRLTDPYLRGDDVKEVQRLLNAHPGTRIAADGVFGPGTDRRVKEFQRAAHLTVDGIVGRNTLSALYRG